MQRAAGVPWVNPRTLIAHWNRDRGLPGEPGTPAWRGPRLDLERLGDVTAALAARAEERDRAGSFPAEGIAAVHAAGLLTATVAERYGGPGAGLAETVSILRALGRGDPSVALVTADRGLFGENGT